MTKPRVLVVDDEPENLSLVERTLRGEFRVISETSPQRALAFLKENDLSLIIADQRMPGMSGTQLLEQARIYRPRAARVILSAFTDVPSLLEAINECRIDRFLNKPIRSTDLLACARALTAHLHGRPGTCLVRGDDREACEILTSAIAQVQDGVPQATDTELRAGSSPSLLVLLLPHGIQDLTQTVKRLGERRSETMILVALAHRAASEAAVYLSAGADDVVWAPAQADEVVLRYRAWEARRKAEDEVNRLRAELSRRDGDIGIIGESPAMRAVFETIERVAHTDSTVLISGETGTGKELVARAIHRASPRRDKTFVPVNLSAVPESLIESELFGHVTGAFTGATGNRAGRVEAAQGGTLFLDEVGDLPGSVQVKLLRLLQERTYERVGSTRPQKADFRLLAATHRELPELIEQGRFREDLYYRLNVVQIALPPLRRRRSDIAPLAEYFLQRFCARFNRGAMTLSPEALDELVAYSWPGNVRELEHTLERAVALGTEGNAIGSGLIVEREPRRSFRSVVQDGLSTGRSLQAILQDIERVIILETLQRYEGNQTLAAQKLKVPRTTLRSRIEKLGL